MRTALMPKLAPSGQTWWKLPLLLAASALPGQSEPTTSTDGDVPVALCCGGLGSATAHQARLAQNASPQDAASAPPAAAVVVHRDVSWETLFPPNTVDLAKDGAVPAVPAAEGELERFSPAVLEEIKDLRENYGMTAEDALLTARALSKQEVEIDRAAAIREVREAKGDAITETEAAVLNSAVWPKSPRIPVYFMNASASELANECVWIRKAIERTWERAADVKFTEWRALPAGAVGGIRIRFSPTEHPHTVRLGRHLNGVNNGMRLTNTFQSYTCPVDRRHCIETIAVHEFGHALGFAHEHNRDDAEDCGKEKQGTTGDNPVTVYDPRSIMNYCNKNWTAGNLSTLDKRAAEKLYGKR